MEQVEIAIQIQTITAQFGTLEAGTVVRLPAAFAKHLVDDCNAAKYTKPRAAVAPAEAASGPVEGADAAPSVHIVQTSAQNDAAPASEQTVAAADAVQTSALHKQDAQSGRVVILAPLLQSASAPATGNGKKSKGAAKGGKRAAIDAAGS